MWLFHRIIFQIVERIICAHSPWTGIDPKQHHLPLEKRRVLQFSTIRNIGRKKSSLETVHNRKWVWLCYWVGWWREITLKLTDAHENLAYDKKPLNFGRVVHKEKKCCKVTLLTSDVYFNPQLKVTKMEKESTTAQVRVRHYR